MNPHFKFTSFGVPRQCPSLCLVCIILVLFFRRVLHGNTDAMAWQGLVIMEKLLFINLYCNVYWKNWMECQLLVWICSDLRCLTCQLKVVVILAWVPNIFSLYDTCMFVGDSCSTFACEYKWPKVWAGTKQSKRKQQKRLKF